MQTGAPDLATLSGPQLHIFHTITELRKLGHIVKVVAIQENKIMWSDNLETWKEAQLGFTQNPWFKLFERALRRIQSTFHFPFLGLFDSLRFADACSHELSGFNILYERHGWMGYGGVIASRWMRIPLVIELNGNIIKEIEVQGFQLSPIQWKISRWLTFMTFDRANSVIVVSERLKYLLVNELHLSDEKIKVVINGADLALFSQHFDEGHIREKYNLHSKDIITYVGSFQPWHGIDLLIASYKLILRQYPQSELILIGDGASKQDIQKQIANLGMKDNVNMLGRLSQKEVAEVLSISDIAVIPYPYENSDIVGTPLKLIEYMAAGKAIVASTMPIHEIIVDMETGLRVPPANAEALSSATCRLLADPQLRSKLGENAQQESQAHSWENVSKTIENILLSF